MTNALKVLLQMQSGFLQLESTLGLAYKSMRGVMTNSIDQDQWLNVTSKSRDRI
jgi:hypothetical protein